MFYDEPALLPVLRNERDAGRDRVFGIVDRITRPFDQHLTAQRLRYTEQGMGQFRPPSAHQARHHEYLSAPHYEIHRISGMLGNDEVLAFENGNVGGFMVLVVEFFHVPADHQLNHAHRADLRFREKTRITPVAEGYDAIREIHHLAHTVGDIDDADAVVPEILYHLEQLLGFPDAERTRRLVHDQYLRVDRQGLGDLDHLLISEGQIADYFGRRAIELYFVQQNLGVGVYFFPVHQFQEVPIPRFPSQENVGRDVQVIR